MPPRSGGVLLYRRSAGDLEVLLGHPGGPFYTKKDDGVWTIPKGELEPGEDEPAAAVREFTEEMGSAPREGTPLPLGEAKQSGGKVNVVWALAGDFEVASLRSNTFPMEWPPRSGHLQQFEEIDRVAWFDLDMARRKLRPAQLPFLDRLISVLGG
ncbi:MAG TPA: NUDIX domain-containing protein [Frankiaceae bacterium]|nr:NUDIX domain-containing protein [Frankiaceae bacterium]